MHYLEYLEETETDNRYDSLLLRETYLEEVVQQVASEWDTKLYKLLDIVLASLRLLGDKDLHRELYLLKKRSDRVLRPNISDLLRRAFRVYKRIDPTISSISSLQKEWDSLASFRKTILKKRINRKRMNKTLAELKGRLYPLQKDKYNEIANKIWVRRGSPKFGKKKINGVTWGDPQTITNHKYGWRKVVRMRIVGCKIVKGKIVLSIADPH